MNSRQALPNLTTVRLLAALYVFGFHFFQGYRPLYLGMTGVTLFFVLSGFILAYNYPTVPDRKRFFAFRFARIYPLYAVSLLIRVPQYVHSHRHSMSDLLAVPLSFALVQTWFPSVRYSLNTAGWTLPVEAFFYICFPFLLPVVARQMSHWKAWAAASAMLLVIPTTLTFFVLMPAAPTHAALLKDLLNLPVFHLGEFFMGMFLGLHFQQARPVFLTRHILLSISFLAVCTFMAQQIPLKYQELTVDGLLALPYALLIYTLAGWRSEWFAHPLLQLGGEISYGIYLLQFPVEMVLYRIWAGRGPAYSTTLLLCTAAAAYLSYMYIEKPARVWILRSMGYHPAPKPIPTPGLQT